MDLHGQGITVIKRKNAEIVQTARQQYTRSITDGCKCIVFDPFKAFRKLEDFPVEKAPGKGISADRFQRLRKGMNSFNIASQ